MAQPMADGGAAVHHLAAQHKLTRKEAMPPSFALLPKYLTLIQISFPSEGESCSPQILLGQTYLGRREEVVIAK
jgi:hypothetical protein